MLSLHRSHPTPPDDAVRLDALARTRLLDTPPEARFDRLTALASEVLGTPVALVTLVGAERAFFKSAVGMGEGAAAVREVPLTHSICPQVVAGRSPVSIEDLRQQPALADNGAVRDLGAVAYLGMPITDGDGHTLGALCVLDSKPRQWSERDLSVMRTLAACVSAEIERGTQATIAAHADAQKFEALSRLAGTVAHDFNNVLAVVSGYSDLLQGDESLSVETRSDAAEIQRAGDRGRILTQQLASITRQVAVMIAPCDANDVVREVARSLSADASAGAGLTLELAADLPPVLADAQVLAQVLVQLLANARDAMPGGGQIVVRTSRVAESGAGGAVCVAVQDTGLGMDEATLEKIFEPFYTTRKLSGGRGLGLTTVRNQMMGMRGRVEAESTLGAGSTVRLLLPITAG